MLLAHIFLLGMLRGRSSNVCLWALQLLLVSVACDMKLSLNFLDLNIWQRCWKLWFSFAITVPSWYIETLQLVYWIESDPAGQRNLWRSLHQLYRLSPITPFALCITWLHIYCSLTGISVIAEDELLQFLVDSHVSFLENWGINWHMYVSFY